MQKLIQAHGNWVEGPDRFYGREKEIALFIESLREGANILIVAQRRMGKTSLMREVERRFVVTGSIGLEPILRQAKLSATINAFKPLTLPPWDNSTAVGCLRALANNYNVKISEEVCELMVSKLGCCIPHHVQMFFSHIYDEYRGSEDPVTPDMIAFVYTTRMLSSRGHAELSTFEERLEQMLGRELYPLAMDILTETAVVGKLTAEAIQVHCAYYGFERKESGTIARQILDIFEHDGYIMKERESYVFVSKLLKDWWKARHSFGFIIAEERGNA